MKLRYQIAFALLIIAHVALTPFLVSLAYAERGAMAMGGEYLVLPLIAIPIIAALSALEKRDARRKNKKERLNYGDSNSNHNR